MQVFRLQPSIDNTLVPNHAVQCLEDPLEVAIQNPYENFVIPMCPTKNVCHCRVALTTCIDLQIADVACVSAP